MNNKEKFLNLVSETDNSVLEQIKWRRDNRLWIKRSQAIALMVLSILKERGMSQKELASKMGISPQQVNKWLKGNENFTFETISKIEEALQTELIFIVDPHIDFSRIIESYQFLKSPQLQSSDYKKLVCTGSKMYGFNQEKPEFFDHF